MKVMMRTSTSTSIFDNNKVNEIKASEIEGLRLLAIATVIAMADVDGVELW